MNDRLFKIVLLIATSICLAISDNDNKFIKYLALLGIIMVCISLI